jgi:hypothetical protein
MSTVTSSWSQQRWPLVLASAVLCITIGLSAIHSATAEAVQDVLLAPGFIIVGLLAMALPGGGHNSGANLAWMLWPVTWLSYFAILNMFWRRKKSSSNSEP